MSQLKRTVLITASLVLVAVVGKSGSDIYQAIKANVNSAKPVEEAMETLPEGSETPEIKERLPDVNASKKHPKVAVCDMPPEQAASFDYQKASQKMPTVKFGTFGNSPELHNDGAPQLEHKLICPYGDRIVLMTEQTYTQFGHATLGGLIATLYNPASGKVIARHEYAGNGFGGPPEWELLRTKGNLNLKIDMGFTNQGCTWSRVTLHDLKDNSVISQTEDETCDWGNE